MKEAKRNEKGQEPGTARVQTVHFDQFSLLPNKEDRRQRIKREEVTEAEEGGEGIGVVP